MYAIILAAGRGTRLSRLNPDQRPKCLLDIGGRSLLARQLELLYASGIEQADLVLGYEADRIVEEVATLAVRPEVRFHYNRRFREGSTISLLAAQETLRAGGDLLLLDADVLFHPAVLEALVRTEVGNCFLLDREFEVGEEPVKIAVKGGTIVEFRKQLPDGLSYDILGESVGLFRFGPDAASRIAQRCEVFDADGMADAPHEEVLRAELLNRPEDFSYEDVTGLPWIEIDFDADLQRARRQILPHIRRDYPGF